MEITGLLSNYVLAVGIVMLVLSIIFYIKRTGDYKALTKFWASKAELNKSELIFNRVGLAFVIVGVILPVIFKITT